MDYEWNKDVGVLFAALVVLITSMVLRYKRRSEGKGVVTELNIYPIKSCAEMNVKSAKVTPRGFEYDRMAQVCTADGSFCTPREEKNSKLFHIRPEVVVKKESDNQQESVLLNITAPDDSSSSLSIDISSATMKNSMKVATVQVMGDSTVQARDFGEEASQWISQATGIDKSRIVGYDPTQNQNDDAAEFQRYVEVNPDQGDQIPSENGTKAPVSLADEAPFLLTSVSSLEDLNKKMKQRNQKPVDMRRFRPNIVLKGFKPWEEDTFSKIQIGGKNGPRFYVWQRCGRCRMTTIDRDTLTYKGEPLNTLSTFRERANGQRNFGMHLIPVVNDDQNNTTIGSTVSVGDTLEVLEYDAERLAEWKKLFG